MGIVLGLFRWNKSMTERLTFPYDEKIIWKLKQWLIGQFVHPVGVKRVDWGDRYFSFYKIHFIREHIIWCKIQNIIYPFGCRQIFVQLDKTATGRNATAGEKEQGDYR